MPAVPPAVNAPGVQRLGDGTVITARTDSYGRTWTMREYPNGTTEIENRVSQRRTIQWPDGASEETPILVHARWTTAPNGTRSESDSNGRLITTVYPDGSSVRFDYEANSSSARVLGITVRGPESEGSPILQSMRRGAFSQNFTAPDFQRRANEEHRHRFEWSTRDAQGTLTSSEADAHWDPREGAIRLSNSLETTFIRPNGTRAVDDHLHGSRRSFDADGRVTAIAPSPGGPPGRQSATITYGTGDNNRRVESVVVPGIGRLSRHERGWTLPNGTVVEGELILGRSSATVVGPADARGARAIHQFTFNGRERPNQSFTLPREQVAHLTALAQRVGAGNGARGIGAAMELLEGVHLRRQDADRRYLDALNTAAYRANNNSSNRYPAPLAEARLRVEEGFRMLYERERLFAAHDYGALSTRTDLNDGITARQAAARERIEGFVPSLGDVGRRIVDDLPARIGSGINYAVEHPFQTVLVVGGGVALGVFAPELALAVAVTSVTVNGTVTTATFVVGYVNGDARMVWRGTDRAGDLLIEGALLAGPPLALRGVGILARPIAVRITGALNPESVLTSPEAIDAVVAYLGRVRGRTISDAERQVIAQRQTEIVRLMHDMGVPLPRGRAIFQDPAYLEAMAALNDGGTLFSGFNSTIRLPVQGNPTATHELHVVFSRVVQDLGGAEALAAMPRAARMTAIEGALRRLYDVSQMPLEARRFTTDATNLMAAVGPTAAPRFRSTTRAPGSTGPVTQAEAEALVTGRAANGMNSTGTTVSDVQGFYPGNRDLVVFEYPRGTPGVVLNGEGAVTETGIAYRTVMGQNAGAFVPNEIMVGTPRGGWRIVGIEPNQPGGYTLIRLAPATPVTAATPVAPARLPVVTPIIPPGNQERR